MSGFSGAVFSVRDTLPRSCTTLIPRATRPTTPLVCFSVVKWAELLSPSNLTLRRAEKDAFSSKEASVDQKVRKWSICEASV